MIVDLRLGLQVMASDDGRAQNVDRAAGEKLGIASVVTT